MAKIRLRRVHRFVDQHGKVRFYVRIPGKPAVPLSDEPGSAPFMAEYHAVMCKDIPAPALRMVTGSVAAAIALYLNSADFLRLAPSTRIDQRRILEGVARTERATLPFARMEKQDVEQLLAEKAGAPHAAKSLLKALRSAAKVAVKSAMIAADPTAGVTFAAPTSECGFKMWTEDDIAQFEACWPIGTRERLAFALLLYTGQRRGDEIRMGRQHARDGVLAVRQAKTGAADCKPSLTPPRPDN